MFQVAIAFILGCAFNSLIRSNIRHRSFVIKQSEQQAELAILNTKVCAIRNKLRISIESCKKLSSQNTFLREKCRRLSVLANRELLKGLTGDLRGRYSYASDCNRNSSYDGYGHIVVKRASYEV